MSNRPAQSEQLVVRGGRGGTRAAVEDLRRAARALADAAGLLDDARASVTWARREGLEATAVSPGTAHAAQAQVEPLLRGPASLDALAGTLRSLAWCLHGAAEVYEDAERSAVGAMRSVLAVGGATAAGTLVGTLAGSTLLAGWLLPRALLAATALRLAGVRLPGPSSLTVDVTEHAVQLLGGFGHGSAPGTGPHTAVPAVRTSGHLVGATAIGGLAVRGLRPRPLRVTARLEAAGAIAPPRDAADVLARVADLYPRGGGAPGTVGVDRLDHPDGSRTWVVMIPGTQEALSWGTSDNPMDMLTNVRLMGGTPDDGTLLVARALDQAGARPGEPVLLAGHSQGGLVATALAGSAAFTARHPVAAVLTAGSPVATHAIPARTPALHLEHRQDLVPALDGWRNPDQPHRTTVVRDLGSSPAPVDRWAARSPGGAHAVEAYARTASAAHAAGGRSVRGWEQAATQVLGGPGTTAHHREFTAERVPSGAPPHVPPAERAPVPPPGRTPGVRR